ncbi:Plexin-A4 [Camponotus floridanus]|uniref:Plexin-A4 n=1 Tax=Camponotus floridanus TaxID=104421 RepID=E2ANK2_CAMFO|nr:Plexin-A4 [Camponotus floridanus]
MLSVFPAAMTGTMKAMRSTIPRSRRRGCRLPLPLMILILTLSLSSRLPTARSLPADIVQKFHDSEVERMNHLVVDKNTGRVYVGAVNRLYQLSPDLVLVVKEVTGPKGDSTACSMLDCPREAQKRPVDNVNKALVIDYTTTRLISCGSLFQGMCTVRNLHNISDVVQEVKEANNKKYIVSHFGAPCIITRDGENYLSEFVFCPTLIFGYFGITFETDGPFNTSLNGGYNEAWPEIKLINGDARRGCSSNSHNQRVSLLFLAVLFIQPENANQIFIKDIEKIFF